jgi:hypothetical protein
MARAAQCALAAVVLAFFAGNARAQGCSSPCDGLAGAFAGVVIAGISEGSVAVGGLTTMIGGAVDLGRGRHTRSWRVANVVFGVINLVAAVAWGGVAAANISPQFSASFAVPHLAIGIGDVVVAGVSFSRR